ncbi:hypothetical protein E2C01_100114 [Portunus trituberculatus]|uniref:Uncharacterized protein n=1 Tax=Portunus trituberculatus TaxID=210409 RepID=A0A5B7KGK5_PORTR|nr:hypothetical protein [Portunus trituberculatus]
MQIFFPQEAFFLLFTPCVLFTGISRLKRILFCGTSYLKAHPLGNPCPECGSPTYTRTVDRIRTSALGDPSDPTARMVPLYHGGPKALKP